MKRHVLAVLSLLILVGMAPADGTRQTIVAHLLDESVMVRVHKAAGSGVIFKNGSTTFVWTAAHVIEPNQKVQTVIDGRTGRPKVKITYDDAMVVRELQENGRKVGELRYFARVVRYSDGDKGGDDLALLRLYKQGAFERSVTFLDDRTIPVPGVALWHVGSMSGGEGLNSVSQGVFAAAGRLRASFRAEELASPRVYDQINVTALKGCSGGGVFRQQDGVCIGLLTEGLSNSVEAPNCIVPARRIREFAHRTHCDYAVNARVAVPVEMEDRPPTDNDIPLPREWLPAPAPAPSPHLGRRVIDLLQQLLGGHPTPADKPPHHDEDDEDYEDDLYIDFLLHQ